METKNVAPARQPKQTQSVFDDKSIAMQYVRDDPKVKPGSTIGQLQTTMDGNAYMILLDLVNWSRLWDDLYNDEVTWDDPTMRAMMYPFLGFGHNPQLWASVSMAVMPLIQSEIGKWVNQEAYRASNSMTWATLGAVAPALASSTHGFEGMQACHKILEQGFIE